ncbi:uncharacterized protein LOC126843206 [Adelges cooleyi]|uniref:uncharacterized protein LOC126843206 n=1 Tax=Adelges cooleyi TaxID=133065 RepID=UPI0021804774|nr:uncharacterized protein LOC126843206 [Adelges cooleyi]
MFVPKKLTTITAIKDCSIYTIIFIFYVSDTTGDVSHTVIIVDDPSTQPPPPPPDPAQDAPVIGPDPDYAPDRKPDTTPAPLPNLQADSGTSNTTGDVINTVIVVDDPSTQPPPPPPGPAQDPLTDSEWSCNHR